MTKSIDILAMLSEEASQKQAAHAHYRKHATPADKILLGLLLITIGLVPLILLGSYSKIQPPVISDNYYLKLTGRGDFFSYYKSVALHWLTLITAIVFAIKIFVYNGKIKKTIANYFVGGAIVALLLSALLSPAMTIAFYGLPNRAEGTLTSICYLVLFFIALNTEYPKNIVRIILFTFIPFIFINLWIILTHFYGNSIFAYEWVRNIVGLTLPGNMAVPKEADIVGTLNQWNYMSGMFSLLTAVYLTAAIFVKEKAFAIVYGGIAIVTGAISLLSISTGGFLVISMMIAGIFIYALRYNAWKRGLVVLLIFIVCYASLSVYFGKTNEQVYNESVGKVTAFFKSDEAAKTPTPAKPSTGTEADNKDTTSYKLPVIPAPGMSGLSGRIYIWDKTWESALERPLLGYGMDTNIYFFPHNNIDARAQFNSETITVGKPHSIYLGFIQGTGFIGFLPIFALMLTIVYYTLRPLIWRQQEFPLAAILGAGFIAYLMQGIVNDSVVGISAALWPIAGITLALFLQQTNTTQQATPKQ